MPESSSARLEEARILVQDLRQNGAGHKILNRAVGERCPLAFCVTFGTLSVSGFAIFGLADTGKKAIPRVLNIVERRADYDLELLSRGERRYLPSVL
jgi:hypothetical protein